MEIDVEGLKQRFIKTAEWASSRPVDVPARAWADMLVRLYRQPHRKYHNLGHVADLLRRLDATQENAHLPGNTTRWVRRPAVELAIWFHDAIYEVGSRRNEDQSKHLAEAFLNTADVTYTGLREEVLAAIDATKHDGRAEATREAMLMVDLDLAGFADPWPEFEASNRRIREEFARYSDEEYRWGRIKFLSGLMTRPIFNILIELEEPAKVNIARHMRDLISGAKP